jgi:hypothetical protein
VQTRFVVALGATLALLAAACGGDDSGPTATPAGSPSPATTGPAGSTCETDLGPGTAATHVFGAADTDYMADRFSLAAGDFNDDGFDDALIGAPLADGPDDTRLNSGEAYVIFGSDSLPPVVDTIEGTPLTIYGAAPSDNLGLTVVAGDINGDGVDDIVAGARFASVEGRDQAGKVYVIFGRADLPDVFDMAAEDYDVAVVGIDPADFLGISVSAADVTADGIDDLIAGAISGAGPAGNRARAGEVHVVPGAADIGGVIDLRVNEPFFSVYGAHADDALANFISAGDFDGDGRGDLLLGAPLAEGGDVSRTDAGEAYIVPVPEAGGTLDLAAGEGFTRITGALERDQLGHFVAGGDVDGDGTDDAVISARDADGPDDSRNNAGELHVLYGRSDLPAAIDLAEEPLDAVVYGRDAGDSLGFSLAAGDVNGDGMADIVAGAPAAEGCRNSRIEGGDAYVIHGGGLPAVVDLARDEPDAEFFGPRAGDQAGFSVATGDFNGDGIGDLLIGALLADGPELDRTDAGEAYIVLSE